MLHIKLMFSPNDPPDDYLSEGPSANVPTAFRHARQRLQVFGSNVQLGDVYALVERLFTATIAAPSPQISSMKEQKK
jgi:hypothetical protein